MGIKQSVLTPIKLSYDCDVCGGNVLPNRGDMDSNHWYSTFDAKRIPSGFGFLVDADDGQQLVLGDGTDPIVAFRVSGRL